MVKRVDWRRYGILVFALIVMIMCWEKEKSSAAFASGAIPEESIRLRILANSDTLEDQAVKRLIRDRIIERMNAWVAEPQGIETAREVLAAHLPELTELAGQTLAERGFPYDAHVEIGQADFPTKMYGSRVYPAGEYEALRVTLGSGNGQNWWCVLFPPLCFVDAVTGEAVAAEKTETDSPKKAGEVKPAADTKKSSKVKEQAKEGNAPKESKTDLQVQSKQEVRFFIWDLLKAFFEWLRGLFA
jgi:stage II sporulation protein R